MSQEYNDRGGASRFFYVDTTMVEVDKDGNIRPTESLLKYFEKLITPTDGLCLTLI